MKIEVSIYTKEDLDTLKTPLIIKDAYSFQLTHEKFYCISKNDVSINVPREEILSLNINSYDYEREGE